MTVSRSPNSPQAEMRGRSPATGELFFGKSQLRPSLPRMKAELSTASKYATIRGPAMSANFSRVRGSTILICNRYVQEVYVSYI